MGLDLLSNLDSSVPEECQRIDWPQLKLSYYIKIEYAIHDACIYVIFWPFHKHILQRRNQWDHILYNVH